MIRVFFHEVKVSMMINKISFEDNKLIAIKDYSQAYPTLCLFLWGHRDSCWI